MRSAVVLVVFSSVACTTTSSPPDVPLDAFATDAPAADGPTSDTGPSGPATYYRDVRPVLAEHCVQCHSAGSIGPFTLDTFESARAVGSRLVDATASRRMPPYLADNSGDCQTYRDANWLTDDELAALANWARDGFVEGDPATPAPTIRPLPSLRGDVRTLDIGVDFGPDRSVTDDYRCFVLDSPGAGSVTGYDVQPGNRAIVHHVIVYEPQSDADAARARALDAESPSIPGYPCFGGARVDALPIVLWAPGAGATLFPAPTGVEVAARPVVVQVHYNTRGAPMGTDRTRVQLQYAAGSVIPAYIVPIVDSDFRLPPRMASVSSTEEVSLSQLGTRTPRIYGSFPHMHTLGRSLRVELGRTSGDECVLNVPSWDFNWQLAYWYRTPIRVTATDRVRITCEWDTRTRDSIVTWGEGTEDEMCLNFVYVSL